MSEVTWYICIYRTNVKVAVINFKYKNIHYFLHLYADTTSDIKEVSSYEVFDCCGTHEINEDFIKDNERYPVLKRHALKLASNLYQELIK